MFTTVAQEISEWIKNETFGKIMYVAGAVELICAIRLLFCGDDRDKRPIYKTMKIVVFAWIVVVVIPGIMPIINSLIGKTKER